jgi:hypothetical protein
MWDAIRENFSLIIYVLLISPALPVAFFFWYFFKGHNLIFNKK